MSATADSKDSSEEVTTTENFESLVSGKQGNADSSRDLVTTDKSGLSRVPQNHYEPSVAGSVIEAEDGFGGTIFIRIQNIASTTNFGCRLDLKKIALKCRNTEFNPRRFGAVIMRLREPRATALIFSSGKLCVTGLRSLHNVHLACKKFHYIIERVGFQPTPNCDMKVQNVVGTVDVGFPIRLEGLVYAHSAFASYEPELFPGLIYRLLNPRVVFLIFVSGKLVITGAKKESDLSIALTKLFPVLVEFKKEHVASVNAKESTGPPLMSDTISSKKMEEV